MRSLPTISDLLQRTSLSGHVAACLRKAISESYWKESLPSERRLSEMLHVSRPTIRAALHLLAKEGLLDIQQGRRNRLLSRPKGRAPVQTRLAVLVTHEAVSHATHPFYQDINEMRAQLVKHGFDSEFLVCQTRGARAQRRIEEFVRQNRVFCCALIAVSKGLQQWFAGHSIPALVVGSCHAGIKLPSVEVDFRMVCRHATGIFLSKGHRRIALIIPNSAAAGDLASEEGFREGIAQHVSQAAHGMIVRHRGTADDITAKLDALFSSPRAPTALLVAKPPHVFIVIIYLLKRGLTMPDTVSLIARDHDRIFEIVSPPISHYTFKDGAFEHRLSRLMLQLVNQGYLPREPSLVFPQFFAGGTVKQLT